MRAIVLSALLILCGAIPAVAGPCDHWWQTASDGSSCGGRAADQKAGGN